MLDVESVAPFAAVLGDPDQSCPHEPLQVAGGRGPRVAEPLGELARGHGASPRVQRHEDVTSVLVGQRPKDGLELVELAQAPRTIRQRVSLVSKCGNAMPGPMALSSTNVAIRSHIAPILGCW